MPTIEHSASTGTNANISGGFSVNMTYNHPGGLMVVFFTHQYEKVSGTTCTFNSVSLGSIIEHIDAGDWDGRTIGLFIATMPAGNHNLKVYFNGASKTERSLTAFSISGDDGYRDSNAISVDYTSIVTLNQSVTTQSGDLVLQGCGWRNSAANVSSYSSGQTAELADDSPTRTDTSKKTASSTSTTVTTTLTSSSNNRGVSITVSIKAALDSLLGADLQLPGYGRFVYQ